MAEASDKFVIRLLIGNQLHPLTVARDQEKLYRDAADYINKRLTQYRTSAPNQTEERYNAVVMLDLALQVFQMQEKNDTRPYVEALSQLTHELEEALGEDSH